MRTYKFKNLFSKNKFYYTLFFIFIVSVYDGFLNTYILLNSNYQERMIKYAGYCDKQGYGFIKFINNKYQKEINANIPVISYRVSSPNAGGYFYDIKKIIAEDYVIFLASDNDNLKKIKLNDYIVINKKSNCYFLKKR